MAKFHLDRLRGKYKNVPVTGQTYQELIGEIISHQSERISRKIISIDKEGWQKALPKVTKREKVLVPDVESVLPKQSVFARKGAERGELLRDTLRDRLTSDLRQSIGEWNERTKGPKISKLFSESKRKDTINPKLIKEFEGKIKETFSGYTKKDPTFGMPTNIHTIAVTEVRSTINEIKDEYAEKVLKDNPDVELSKEWRHNKSLSSEYRPGHLKMNKVKVGHKELFEVESYIKKRGKWVFSTVVKMKYPHDPQAPAGEVIGCNCDYIITIRAKKIKKGVKKDLTNNADVIGGKNMEKNLIKISAHPYRYDEGLGYFASKKTDKTGQERRYLRGVATGIAKDAYGENLTVDCINSILKQKDEQDILFFMEPHGVCTTNDIGILSSSEVAPNKDLIFECRLWDELDEQPQSKLDVINTLWRQLHGVGSYNHKRQIGFSIEGITSLEDIESYKEDSQGNMVERVIKNMDLLGVIICTRPAYTASIVSGVYKSLKIVPEGIKTEIRKSFEGRLIEKAHLGDNKEYYVKKWELDDALNSEIELIMKSNQNKSEELNILLDVYKNIHIDLVMKSKDFFAEKEDLKQKNLIAKRKEIVKRADFLVNRILKSKPAVCG